MRKNLVSCLRPLNAIAVENLVGIGTPDINCSVGWIECKWLRSWPKREATVVKLTHDLQKHQRLWIRQRRKAGGNAWVMLQCKKEWLLIEGIRACDNIGKVSRTRLIELSCYYSKNGLTQEKLLQELTNSG